MRGGTRNQGFTLIELMIVVAIAGILAAIAYPSYTQYIESARRSDAQGALLGLASAMERHRAANGTYVGAGSSGTGNSKGSPTIYADESPLDGSTKFYDLTIEDSDGSSYTLRATPKNAQAGDGFLELDHTGARRWDKNNDGDTNDSGEDSWEK